MTEPEQSNNQGGWSNMGGQARKFHYFDSNEPAAVALCGKWGIWRSHALQVDNGQPGPDDCVVCRRKLDKRA